MMLREARAVVGNSTGLRTLNARQETTVRTMAEMILPKTDTPGATDVGATEFIDLILTEWYEEKERNLFLQGLADVDSRSQNLFGKEFVECSSIERGEILTELGEKMMEQAEQAQVAPQAPMSRRGRFREASEQNFCAMLRRMTLTAYYTSEAGATQALHFEIIPERHDACAEVGKIKEVGEQQ